MSLAFDATYYQGIRPDVFNAFVATQGSTGLTWAQFAEQHFNTFGWLEGSNPNANFVTTDYLNTNVDVAAAGVNPFTHFLQFGSLEGRLPYTGFPLASLDTAAYAAGNPDLAAAGITTEAQLQQHFMLFGQFESRPDTPTVTPPASGGSTFTLTPNADIASSNSAFNGNLPSDFRFSSNSETIEGGPGTINAGDTFIDPSTTDTDVLTVSLTAATGTFTAQNIESANVTTLAAGANLELDNVLGMTSVTATGANNLLIDGFAIATTNPTFNLNALTGTLTVSPATLTGTGATAETMNFSVSGATFGTTATTQSVINIDAIAAGTLETLNIESTGNAANVFGLAFAAGDDFTTLNLTGTADTTLRVEHGDVSGKTIVAGTNTGTTTLSLDRDGATTATTNLINVSGLAAIVARDSTPGTGDALVLGNIEQAAAVTLTYGTTGASSISVKEAAGSGDSASLILDHATDNTAVAVATSLTVNGVETFNITSSGAGTNTNSIAGLTGSAFETIDIGGDSRLQVTMADNSLNYTIDGTDATGILTIDASAETGAATSPGITINGGTANDVLTGSAQAGVANTISGGEGNDTINVSFGTAAIGAGRLTGGDGVDIFDVTAVIGDAANITNAQVITDFALGTSGDQLRLDAGLGDTLVTNTITTTAAVANMVDTTLNIYTTAVDAITDLGNVAGAAAGVDGATVVMVYNNATGFAELWADANGDFSAGAVQVATFENITTVGQLSDFDASQFLV
ncbi:MULTISPECIES: hypothetical protein [unclassified Roseibium]|uniref:beta strand repeat-containing protein n=1 Tax=unclassified Roseibium TaxID=2629323 RepID=UPI00273DE8F5|nr:MULTISPECIES: hypothetical protein [unclassified Roseibium]